VISREEAAKIRARSAYRGLYTIPTTPFDETGAVDFDSLRRCVEFCVECGAHGLVYPVNASEFYTLTDSERIAAIKVAIDTNANAVPFVAGVTGVSPQHSVEIALAAQEAGADALMSAPPKSSLVPTAAGIEEHFRILGEAVEIPIFIQNHDPPLGTVVPLDVIVRLLKEVPTVQYVKEETMPPGQAISAVLEKAGEACLGVQGGMGIRYAIDEFNRGACGNMPGCHITDVYVDLWNALEDGDEEKAYYIHGRLGMQFLIESAFSGIYKEVLVLRGVIDNAKSRVPANRRPLQADDRAELKRVFEALQDLMTWKPKK
jgi:4-hydroxy-tetrahydrodipicolinate synthase